MKKERSIHLDCRVFTECHRDESLCGATNDTTTLIQNTKLVTNPRKVTCKRCLVSGAKMIRTLKKLKWPYGEGRLPKKLKLRR